MKFLLKNSKKSRTKLLKFIFIVFPIILLAVVGIFFLYFYGGPRSLNLVSDKLVNYKLIKDESLEKSELYTYSFEGNYLKIEKFFHLSNENAEALVEDEILEIKIVFASAFSPYPGEISNIIVCNEKFQPKFFKQEINNLNYRYYLLYSNERFGIGVCSQDLIKYKHLIGWIYCQRTKELYGIRYFVPLDKDFNYLEDFFLSLSCG